ncbi:lipopolysaccharide assembly protein LapA domain-containing protein [Aestuariibius sp. 2305UL40-4]|uniref:lipopolysaccharide assembly protein LapA domain-containing protein n=1 Tax=Aestuariibius violaceus TaxID=3234132 RepID=UPI00345E7B8E
MRTLKYAILGLLAICLAAVALANRDLVEVQAMPDVVAGILGISASITLPLFVVILAGVAVGVLIGFLWEWLREHKHRVEMRQRKKEVNRLEAEMSRMREEKHEGQDEVLALLEERQAGR